MKKIVAIFLIFAKFCNCDIEPFIVGGNFTTIEKFPHSAFLTINCVYGNSNKDAWICGASIINQEILLTAAHCVAKCTSSSVITINVGSTNKNRGFAATAHSFMIHEDYTISKNDIGMIKSSRTLQLSSKISRVTLMPNPPYAEVGQVAGWGTVDDRTLQTLSTLKSVNQKIWSKAECVKVLGNLPLGTLCAGDLKSKDYVSYGDSGSALIIHNYIQIGLVAYKFRLKSQSLVVYTNVSYYYKWIEKNSKALYCSLSETK